MRKNKAFTILELLVVVAIIAILAIIAIPNFIGRIDEAKDSQELAEINAVSKAVAAFYADKGYYPTLQRDVVSIGQPQPVEGSPHNVKFSEIVPDYLATLPHFSYWWVDYLGNVYHTDTAIGSLSGNTLTLAEGYTYKLNDTTVLSGSTYTLQAGDYIAVADSKGTALPKINANFKNEMSHPEDPDFVPFEGQTFTYTGSVQTFVVPMTGTYQLKVYGASGGAAKDPTYGSVVGGLGGRSEGKIVLTGGTELKIYVGGKGTDYAAQGGWNGGGNGASLYASGGGGGTDIRLGGTDLSNRIIVAGGGGGSFFYSQRGMAGGAGGGTTGGVGAVQSWYFGSGPSVSGGSQTAGGTGAYATALGILGQGGKGATGYAAGGGGGYYGGSGGEQNGGAGAGGSGYVGGVTAGVMATGVRAGDGLVEITRAVD